jgi:hypothetical protein
VPTVLRRCFFTVFLLRGAGVIGFAPGPVSLVTAGFPLSVPGPTPVRGAPTPFVPAWAKTSVTDAGKTSMAVPVSAAAIISFLNIAVSSLVAHADRGEAAVRRKFGRFTFRAPAKISTFGKWWDDG